MLELVSALMLAASQPGACSQAGADRMEATRHLLEGRALSGLQIVTEGEAEDCPLSRPVRGHLLAHLGDWRNARRVSPQVEYAVSCTPAEDLGGTRARPALAEIRRAARDHQWILINESHVQPADRAFAWLAAEALYEEGFRRLAIEDLTPAHPRITARGYVAIGDGADVIEPQFALFIERALALGYELVAYEAIGGDRGRSAVERRQAENLVSQVGDSQAGVLVFAGAGHVREDVPANGLESMAVWLERLSGQPVFTVSQDACAPVDHDRDAFVVLEEDRPGASFDLIVRVSDAGEPVWPEAVGLHPVSPPHIPQAAARGLAVMELIYPDRIEGAAPADRVLLRDGTPVRELYARPGRYGLVFESAGGERINVGDIEISGCNQSTSECDGG